MKVGDTFRVDFKIVKVDKSVIIGIPILSVNKNARYILLEKEGVVISEDESGARPVSKTGVEGSNPSTYAIYE